jgi:hypothetical protein
MSGLGERLGHRSPEVVNPGALASVVLAQVVDDVDTRPVSRNAVRTALGSGEVNQTAWSGHGALAASSAMVFSCTGSSSHPAAGVPRTTMGRPCLTR